MFDSVGVNSAGFAPDFVEITLSTSVARPPVEAALAATIAAAVATHTGHMSFLLAAELAAALASSRARE
jgi:hypothetical protein